MRPGRVGNGLQCLSYSLCRELLAYPLKASASRSKMEPNFAVGLAGGSSSSQGLEERGTLATARPQMVGVWQTRHSLSHGGRWWVSDKPTRQMVGA